MKLLNNKTLCWLHLRNKVFIVNIGCSPVGWLGVSKIGVDNVLLVKSIQSSSLEIKFVVSAVVFWANSLFFVAYWIYLSKINFLCYIL